VNAPLRLCFGVHDHQPVGNFDHVLTEATARSYRPFLERLRARPEVRLTAHVTGSLLEWLQVHESATFDLLALVVSRGQVELLTGGFYEPILAILPDWDKIGQIERLTAFIKTQFGVRPRGMWLAERVWEPHLPRAIREAGVEYVLLDDSHFRQAGLDDATLAGYYLTEAEGAVLAVFPISQRLRYLIPFAEVSETLAYLATRRDAGALAIVDDGEKFGVWPGTFAHVYERGWLDRFFDGLLGTPWLELTTFADVIDHLPATGRVYLPTASYREMGEWALPVEAGAELAAARQAVAGLPEGERIEQLLRGGFWRGFLVKYPEVADLYWKMLRLSQSVHREAQRRPEDLRLAGARDAVWRGQANDAYWHGVFGGCYLPHLRRAVRGALLEAERLLGEATEGPETSWSRGDANGDGRQEILVRTRMLAVTINPESGGSLTEIAYLPRALDLADVMTRRPETYHEDIRRRVARGDRPGDAGDHGARTIHAEPEAKEAGLERLLDYDELRRACLVDGFFPAGPPLDALAPWRDACPSLGATRFRSRVTAYGDRVIAVLSPEVAGLPLAFEKRIHVTDAGVRAVYAFQPPADVEEGGARWAVQWNLALTAGDAPDRYLALPGRPTLGSRGRIAGISSVTLVDEWLGVETRLDWSPAAELAWAPVETVSLSEAGFERIYQGTALLLTWRIDQVAAAEWTVATGLTVTTR